MRHIRKETKCEFCGRAGDNLAARELPKNFFYMGKKASCGCKNSVERKEKE